MSRGLRLLATTHLGFSPIYSKHLLELEPSFVTSADLVRLTTSYTSSIRQVCWQIVTASA